MSRGIKIRTPGAPRRSELRRRPQRLAAAGFAVSFLGAIGFAWAYVTAGVRWQGVALAVAFGGLALGFAAWVALLPQGPFVETRESMVPPAADAEALAHDLGSADGGIVSAPLPRRWFTVALGGLGVAGLFPLRSLLGPAPPPGPAQRDTPWADGVPVVRKNGERVRPGDLQLGTALTVFPQDKTEQGDSAVLLLRVDPAELQLPPDRMAWTVDGIVGYSKICTHAGCPVGLFAQGSGELLCPCHQSVFDVYRLAQPRYGPAARALPQLPLGLADDGTLVARGDFPVPPGPGYWRRS